MGKWYGIRKGYDLNKKEAVFAKIETEWEAAKQLVVGINKSVHGVSPEYKSFKNEKDALAYIKSKDYLVKGEDELPVDAIHCYVDGSSSAELNNYSCGIVYVLDGKILHLEKTAGKNKEAAAMQQIGGELLGAMKAMTYAKSVNAQDIIIFFDYKGVALHALGVWERSNEFSKVYYDWCQKFFRENPQMRVQFCKVDAHTGDDFNEIADGLAKQALDIRPDKIFFEMMRKHGQIA